MNLATTTTLRMSPAKTEVEMVVRVTCTGPEDEGAVADTTFKDPKSGIKTTYGVCPKTQRVASGTAVVNMLHLDQPFQSHPTVGAGPNGAGCMRKAVPETQPRRTTFAVKPSRTIQHAGQRAGGRRCLGPAAWIGQLPLTAVLRDGLPTERPPWTDDLFCTPVWRRRVAYTDAPPPRALWDNAMLLGRHATRCPLCRADGSTTQSGQLVEKELFKQSASARIQNNNASKHKEMAC